MSVRLTGKDFPIVVPGAEIVCDVCKKAWAYDPNIVHYQQEDTWQGSTAFYGVTLRHCVGNTMPKAMADGSKHICVQCEYDLFNKPTEVK